jgi:hypothetical protein
VTADEAFKAVVNDAPPKKQELLCARLQIIQSERHERVVSNWRTIVNQSHGPFGGHMTDHLAVGFDMIVDEIKEAANLSLKACLELGCRDASKIADAAAEDAKDYLQGMLRNFEHDLVDRARTDQLADRATDDINSFCWRLRAVTIELDHEKRRSKPLTFSLQSTTTKIILTCTAISAIIGVVVQVKGCNSSPTVKEAPAAALKAAQTMQNINTNNVTVIVPKDSIPEPPQPPLQ